MLWLAKFASTHDSFDVPGIECAALQLAGAAGLNVPPVRTLMLDGLPDESLFWKAALALVMRAARTSVQKPPAIAAFGDCAQTLWHNGTPAAAILLEQFWDDLSKTLNLDLLCGYTLHGVESDDEEMRQLIGATHSATRAR